MNNDPYVQPDEPDQKSAQLYALSDFGRQYMPPPKAELGQSTFGGGGGGPMPPSIITASDRKLAARRFNESVKLVASGLSGLGIGLFGVAFVQPILTSPANFVKENRPVWYLLGLGLHVMGHFIVRTELRKEE